MTSPATAVPVVSPPSIPPDVPSEVSFDSLYRLGPEIGKGSYATVHQCTPHSDPTTSFAVKIIDKSKAGPRDIDDVLHEVKMMQAVGTHPLIVEMHEFFESKHSIHIVLDLLAGGMLFDRIVEMRHYSESIASRLIKNFLLAMEHIHNKGIIHRDLKPENLILKRLPDPLDTEQSYLTDFCIADFGMAAYEPARACCGSPAYLSPEAINVGHFRTRQEPYSTKADIWAVGVITYILLSGKMPFHGRHYKEIFQRIVNNEWKFTGDLWSANPEPMEGKISQTARDFVSYLLTYEPELRPTATEALRHPWVASVQPDVHMGELVEQLRLFNGKRKLLAAMLAFRATTAFIHLDQTPPFLKYLWHEDLLSTVFVAQSQTHRDLKYYVDISRALLASEVGWKMQLCCTCGSHSVCRHIQNVHEMIFVGSRAFDLVPVMDDWKAAMEECQVDLMENPSEATRAEEKVRELEEVIKAAMAFTREFAKIPREAMKANFFVMQLQQQPAAKKQSPAASKVLRAFRRTTKP